MNYKKQGKNSSGKSEVTGAIQGDYGTITK